MADLIKWPRAGNPRILYVSDLFIASGSLDRPIRSVYGECTRTSAPEVGKVIRGKPAAIYPVRGVYRWMVVFRLPRGSYSLDITVVDLEDGHSYDRRTFSFQPGANPHRSLTINWPSDSEDITDQADDFIPYGDLTTNHLGLVSMTPSTTGTPISPIHSTSDPVTLEFWSAEFDTLPALPSGDTYSLHAEDNQGHGQDVVDLVVHS